MVCCDPTNKKDYCKKESQITNDCSPAFKDAPMQWYTHCPGITPKKCSGHQQLIPISDKQRWGHNYLRYVEPGSKWKKKVESKYDVCWWSMHIPEDTYKKGKIKIKFLEISSGINIHVYGSSGKDSREFK